MKRPLGSRPHVAIALALLLVGVAVALAACGHSDSGSVALTQAALPTWAPDASPSPAYTVAADQSGRTDLDPAGTVGTDFTPRVDVEVSALGFFDGNGDGLRQAHRVGIFDRDSEHSVLEALVSSDSTLEGAFRWESVEPPVVLEAGKTYVVAYEADKPMDEEVVGRGDWAPELKPGLFWYDRTSWTCPLSRMEGVAVAGNFKFKPVSAASPSP
jgi:hypothetical protein